MSLEPGGKLFGYGSLLGFILLVTGTGAMASLFVGNFKLAYLMAGMGAGGGLVAWMRVKKQSSLLTYGILFHVAFLVGMGIVHLLMRQAGYLK